MAIRIPKNSTIPVTNPEDGGNGLQRTAPLRIGIVAALPEEIATLTKYCPTQGECASINEGILLAYAGAGPKNARQAAKKLIERRVQALVSWGCAAALSDDLKPGDLLIPDRLVTEQRHFCHIDNQGLQHLVTELSNHLPVKVGTLAESSRIIVKSIEKQEIYRQTGAIGLDMESAAVMQVASEAKLPGLVIRAVVDPVSMDLPKAVAYALNKQGRIDSGKLLYFLLTHPWELPNLVKLGICFNAARNTLKNVAKRMNEVSGSTTTQSHLQIRHRNRI